jgi:hypothetical protein
MTIHPNELTVDNSAVILIDHQPAVALVASSTPNTVLINNNVVALAQARKALGVPTVLTTVGCRVAPLQAQSSRKSVRSSLKSARSTGRPRRVSTTLSRRAGVPMFFLTFFSLARTVIPIDEQWKEIQTQVTSESTEEGHFAMNVTRDDSFGDALRASTLWV